jgi:hypothetical protein
MRMTGMEHKPACWSPYIPSETATQLSLAAIWSRDDVAYRREVAVPGFKYVDPFVAIEEWWGQPLDADLVERISAAPKSRIVEFLKLYDVDEDVELPDKPPGVLRPMVRYSAYDAFEHHSRYEYINVAAKLLLYGHEVAVENPLRMVHPGRAGELDDVLKRLSLIKPLVDSGAVKFFLFSSRTRHPAHAHSFTAFKEEWLLRPEFADILGLMEKCSARPRAYDYGTLTFSLRSELGAALGKSLKESGKFNHLIRNDDELITYRLALLRAAVIDPESRAIRLRPLVKLEVPGLEDRVKSIVSLRQSEETFAEWRAALKQALIEIDQLSADEADWTVQANDIVTDALESIRVRLQKTVRKSAALTAISKGGASLAFSGVGATAGYSVGGNLESSLAGAVASKVVEIGVEYVKAVKERRRGSAILDLIALFSF